MRRLSHLCILLFWSLLPALSFAAEELCPQDSNAKNAPSDVIGVQADINRLNLCVERAKLLKELDDISKQRSDTLHKVTDPMSAGLTGGVSGIAPLPLNALPELPPVKTDELKPGEKRIIMPSGSPMGGKEEEPATKPAEAEKTVWKIRRIWGQAGGVSDASMHAQLSDGKGNLLNVTKGDPLPDGGTVDSVSVRGVTLSQKGKIDALSWEEAADTSSSNPAAPVLNNVSKPIP